MSFVLDASMTVAWHFEDEASPSVRRVAHRAFEEGVAVPQHWLVEVVSAGLRGERRTRAAPDRLEEFVAVLQDMPVEVDPADADRLVAVLLPLAREHRLSIYDAAYLELAQRLGFPLATLDAPLADAARRLGIELIEGE
ncbi:MAG: type II toxin-antitoxin system VapC family toxin [Allosphingosinicella sp.]|uniref:type II toxin-antitoxin system VapC family toxin n=1 Tax=Allosphingosinicella sp. TaxID=2823234 RepID=UPI00394BA4E2